MKFSLEKCGNIFALEKRGMFGAEGCPRGSAALHQGPWSTCSALRLGFLGRVTALPMGHTTAWDRSRLRASTPARRWCLWGDAAQKALAVGRVKHEKQKKVKCLIIPVRILYFKYNFLRQKCSGCGHLFLRQVFHELNATDLILASDSGGSKPALSTVMNF